MARSEDFTQDANGRDGRVVTTLPVLQDFSPELGGSDGLISVASDAHCVWLLVNPTTGEQESSWFSLFNGYSSNRYVALKFAAKYQLTSV